jgi:hypothetical protein
MRRGFARIVAPGLIACALAATPGCKTRHDQFYAEVFTCDPTASRDPCGTTAAGKPMTCFAGTQLGGSNFCVEACDPAQHADTPGYTCVTSGALLQICHPDTEASDPSRGCPQGLQCYRTDLLADEGVCLMMRVCAQDSDCSGDPARRVCAGTLVRGMYSLPALKADHLQCMQATCQSGGSLCRDGESCIGNYYDYGPEIPDICVPNCDGDLHCPPNYACAISSAAPGSPPVCLPGLPGTRCTADQDCVVGDCVDTGAGFSQCVVPLPCGSDLDCAPLDGLAASFVCVEGVPGAGRRCVRLASFNGASCMETSDCPTPQRCFRFSPYQGVSDIHGECRIPCDDGGPCAARGGIPNVCLAGGQGGCYPTNFALPCTTSADCLPEFTCTAVSPDERTILTSPTICTTTCATDDDCHHNPLIRDNGGFCKEGVCRMPGQKGDPCDRDAQCVHSVCALDNSGGGQCAI